MLNRERIIAAAKLVSERDGADRLTIRNLASELDVSPMAVYRHFSSKADILGQLVDAFIADAAVLDHDEPDWQGWMLETARRMRRALASRPELLPLLGDAMVLGVPAFTAMARCLQVLQAAGFERDVAVRLFMQMIQCLIGSVVLEAAAHKPRVAGEKDSARMVNGSHEDLRAALPALQQVLSGKAFDAMMCDLFQGAAQLRGVP